jgi:putative mRNA 3-end processing factor
MSLLEFSPSGIYCPAARVYIDPWKKVDKALITHGHADHARWGMESYLCTHAAAPVIQYRLGVPASAVQSVGYGEAVFINGVRFSFHPAGHIVGSAQIRVEHKGEVWVVSGDYKTEADGISEAFEPIRCHTFISESTFGLPVYRWEAQSIIMARINDWWQRNHREGINSVLLAYSLGKAQRILAHLDLSIGEVYTHPAVEQINEVLRGQGVFLPSTKQLDKNVSKVEIKGALIIAPPAAAGSVWLKPLAPFELGMASGWMSIRGARRRRAVDVGFALSDHADWPGLNAAIEATGAQTVYATHGYSDILAQWLQSKGMDGRVVETAFGTEDGADLEPAKKEEQP